MNLSFGGRPVRIQLESNHIVLIDPLALDGLSEQLATIGELPESEQLRKLQALGEYGLRIGVHRVGASGAGTYQIGPDSFEAVDVTRTDPGVFDVETGSLIVIDLLALSAVVRALSWDRYDSLLQAPVGDDSILSEIIQEVGGPRFAIVTADTATPFTGDGAFRVRAGGLIPISTE